MDRISNWPYTTVSTYILTQIHSASSRNFTKSEQENLQKISNDDNPKVTVKPQILATNNIGKIIIMYETVLFRVMLAGKYIKTDIREKIDKEIKHFHIMKIKTYDPMV